MNKKLLTGLLVSTAAAALIAAAPAADAAVASTVSTDAKVGFTKSNGGFVPNALSLRWVPGEFDFGVGHNVPTAAETYNKINTPAADYVVVSEDRPGAGTNEWKLTVGLNNFVGTTNASASLPGASIGMAISDIKGYDASKGAPNAPGTVLPKTIETATILTPTVNLVAGATATAIVKDGDAGTSTAAFTGDTAVEISNVKLTVPVTAGAAAGETYTSKVVWSLDDAI